MPALQQGEGSDPVPASDQPAAEDLIYRQDGPIAHVTFNRPHARNAMTWAMYEGLYRVCERVDADDSIRVLLLQGAGGRAFVAGTDISQFTAFKGEQDALEYEARMNRNIGRLETLRKPTIALIQGYAVGGGAMLATACDLRLATPSAQFGVPVARTLGNCLSLRNLARMVGLIGPARTKELLFTARLVGAEEGKAIGLFSEIVPEEEIETRGRALAEQIAGHAPLTVQATKEGIRRLQADGPGADGQDLILSCYMSEDFREGVNAFLEKRKPQWRGR